MLQNLRGGVLFEDAAAARRISSHNTFFEIKRQRKSVATDAMPAIGSLLFNLLPEFETPPEICTTDLTILPSGSLGSHENELLFFHNFVKIVQIVEHFSGSSGIQEYETPPEICITDLTILPSGSLGIYGKKILLFHTFVKIVLKF